MNWVDKTIQCPNCRKREFELESKIEISGLGSQDIFKCRNCGHKSAVNTATGRNVGGLRKAPQ